MPICFRLILEITVFEAKPLSSAALVSYDLCSSCHLFLVFSKELTAALGWILPILCFPGFWGNDAFYYLSSFWWEILIFLTLIIHYKISYLGNLTWHDHRRLTFSIFSLHFQSPARWTTSGKSCCVSAKQSPPESPAYVIYLNRSPV